MSKILEMRENRKKAWEAAKAFVETKRDKDGLLSEEDAKAALARFSNVYWAVCPMSNLFIHNAFGYEAWPI